MPDSNDINHLYQEWLGIPAERLPPNHYALLGLKDFESDVDAIEAAAKRRGAYLHQIAAGPERKQVQDLLNQVAAARRTLLNEASRSEYDQQLRQPAPEGLVQDESQPAHTAVGLATQAAIDPDQEPRNVRSPKRPTDWKYHAVSAAVLLAVVGLIYALNRNEGGRRAAEARPAANTAASGEVAARAADPLTEVSEAEGPTRAATSTPRRASQSPIAKPRESGSGLRSGLNTKFENVLSEVLGQPESASSPSASPPSTNREFKPLAGLLIGASRKGEKANEPPKDLVLVDAFPSAIENRFASPSGFDWFDVKEDRLQLKTATEEDRSEFMLEDQQLVFAPGTAVSIQTSIGRKMRSETRAGFLIDGIRVGLKPTNTGVVLFARDRDDDAPEDTVAKIKTEAKVTTLTLMRDPKANDVLQWFTSSGDQRHSGTITVTALPSDTTLAIFVTAPHQETQPAVWLSDLKVRHAD